ncbi:MAG: alpha amylase C-terminal domain-containing protein [Flavobacteriales bacterium]
MIHLPLVKEDPLLKPFETAINNRLEWYYNTLDYINRDFKNLQRFANAYRFFGFNYDKVNKGWWFREWAPNANYLSLIGDFNSWDRSANPMNRMDYGVWEVFLPDSDYSERLYDGSLVKVHISGQNGQLDRIPAFINRVIQNESGGFNGQFIKNSTFKWRDKNFDLSKIKHPIIYEAHIGMAQEEGKVGSYKEFTQNILPKIKKLGYNVIQLMAIQEHPYYASFGYHVSNFFAPSSRFGSPDDLRELINEAHRLEIAVIMDVVHSHAVKNRDEGLAEFDGTELYFEGWHPEWDSRLFDYGKIEIKRFLTSNLKYWMEEFHFDGFRFDGVTSMLYHHHGHTNFKEYVDYFGGAENNDAVLYLQLANTLIHEINPHAISICEDMSGMPGACRKIEEGGLGFDYRLGMGIADYWTTLLKEKQDEEWHMGDLFYNLTNRRYKEKTIAYTESHDQALVGDKTIAFWLMDKEMHTHMSVFSTSINIDRGISLHKMIRFITLTLGGEGYLNFMGNEFGHPEWVDFPREGNNWSYHFARRQWNLPDTDHLKYKFLNEFDRAMIKFIKEEATLKSTPYKIHEDNEKRILVFEKNKLIYIFNFNQDSFENYPIPLDEEGAYKIIFSSDDEIFGGFNRLDKSVKHSINDRSLQIYLPSRITLVLKKT